MDFYTSVNRYGNNILYRGFESGKRVAKKLQFMPTLYVDSNKDTGWTNLEGRSVLPRSFDNMREAMDFVRQYQEVDNFNIYGSTNFVTQFITDKFPHDVKFQREKVNVTTVDIEVASDDGFPFVEEARHPVISITAKNNVDNIYYIWGLYDYDPDKSIVPAEQVNYKKCHDELELLNSFLSFWHHPDTCPDVVTGWNTRLFDFPYLINRTINLFGGD